MFYHVAKGSFILNIIQAISEAFEYPHFGIRKNKKESIRVLPLQEFFLRVGLFNRAGSCSQDKNKFPLVLPFPQKNTSFLFCLATLASVLVMSSVFLLALFTSIGLAQVITNITPDGSLGTKVPHGCSICDITGGTRPGNGHNLFHSFGKFDVGPTGVANFLNESAKPTSNILSRVTGGDTSTILGKIQTNGFGKANLFLMNPYGIVFGQNATLHVGGAAYFTTADYLRLDDGVQFTAMPSAQDALLSIAPIAAFGFLSTNPGGGISVKGSTLSVGGVGKGETLSLVGGNIKITGGTLRAPDGQIHLVSVTSPGTVKPGEGGDIQVNAAQLGQIGLSDNASVNVDGERGGEVVIRAGQLTLDKAVISANTSGFPGAGDQDAGVPPKAGITIQVKDDMLLDNSSSIETNVFGGSSNGGDIVVNVGGKLELRGGRFDSILGPFVSLSGIKTFAFDGSGNAGNIEVNAEKISIIGEWLGMTSIAFSTGNVGNIRLQANDLEMVGKSGDFRWVLNTTINLGDGQGGDVNINIKNGNISLDNGQITATTGETAKGGNVTVEAKNLQMINESTIQTGTFTIGNAGKTTVLLSENLDIRSGSFIGSLVDAGCMETCGAVGDLKLEANDISIQGVQSAVDSLNSPEFTGIRTRSVAQLGGNVEISGNNLQISDNGVIRSASVGSEKAGNITLNLKENLELDNKGQLLATAEGSGNAGDITVLAKNINLLGNSSVKAESTSTGNAGSILLKADDTILIGNSTVTTKAENALGGNIKFTAGNKIQLTDSKVTSLVQEGSGNAGSITFDPDFIVIKNSDVLSTAISGNGGPITLIANSAILIDPFSRLNADSQFGGSGTITIQSPIQNLSGTITPLPQNTLPVTALYGSKCVAGAGGNFSTFVDSKAGSLAPSPGTFLASPFLPLSNSFQATTRDHTDSPSAVFEKGQGASVQVSAYAPPVLFAKADGMSSACP